MIETSVLSVVVKYVVSYNIIFLGENYLMLDPDLGLSILDYSTTCLVTFFNYK